MANRYWIGGTGNWTDTAHWSTTSGGSSGASVPTSSDDVIFDANSAPTVNIIVTIVGGSINQFLSLTTTALTHNLLISRSGTTEGTLETYGNISVAKFSTNGNVNVSVPAGVTSNINMSDAVYSGFSSPSAFYGLIIKGTANFTHDFFISNISVSAGGVLNTSNYNFYGSLQTQNGVSTINLGSSIYKASQMNLSASTILNAGTSEVQFYNPGSVFWDNGGHTFYDVSFTNASGAINVRNFSALPITVSHNFKLTPGGGIYVYPGSKIAISNLIAPGTSTNNIKLQSQTPGSTWTIQSSSGVMAGTYLNIQDSIATGGATFNATTSTNSGNNTGWNFIGPQPPNASFTYTPNPANIYQSQSVSFTDTSTNTPTSWLWDFGDSTTSTSQNPPHAYTTAGTFDVTLTATNAVGSDAETMPGIVTSTLRTFAMDVFDIATGGSLTTSVSATYQDAYFDSASGGGRAIVYTQFQPLAQKEYEYRVFDKAGNFIAVWKDIGNDFAYDQSINQNASALNVEISRSPDNLSTTYSPLLDNAGAAITDNNGTTILVPTQSFNAVGAGSDVDLNYNVQVIAFYGGYEALLDYQRNPILDNNGEQILTPYGAPNGKSVYTGYISDYSLTYGQKTGVDVVVVPHATEQSQYVFHDVSNNTTLVYGSSTDPVQMARDAMTRYIADGGRVTFTAASMPLSGQVAPYTFKLNTTREAIDKSVDLLPFDYYQYADPGENIQYLLQKSVTADHVFWYEKHISELVLRKSITQLVNDVYVIGATTAGVALYKRYSDATSISTIRRGLNRIADSGVDTALAAQVQAQSNINQYKNPLFRTSVTISDGVYDIETIKLGQMVGFRNFGSFVDTVLLQIVTIHRTKHSVTLDLDMLVPSDAKRDAYVQRQLLSEQVADIPIAPV